MKVHHLCVATMCPRAGRLVNHEGRLVCHALLVEAPDGLVLVDSGISTLDCAEPDRLGVARLLAGFVYDPSGTAKARVDALGFSASDVRHVVVTHLDPDHAGGLADFPHATVHVHATELAAAKAPGWRHRARYREVLWAHGPKWAPIQPSGERWHGFEAVRDLPGLPPEILLIPLFGHSPGHSGVAVHTGDGWLLHCGDAYFHAGEMTTGRGTIGLDWFQRLVQDDGRARVANQDRLRALRAEGGVDLFSAHDPTELAALQGR